MRKIILASNSPRRRELLKKVVSAFESVSPDYEENLIGKSFSYDLIEFVAQNKALSIKDNYPDAIIISADTVVVFGSEILCKPKDRQDAFNILKKLSGKTHLVVTAFCIIDTKSQKQVVSSDTTQVEFEKYTDAQINFYIDNFKPFDKAGAYGIQELPDGYVNSVNGSVDNVIGFPVEKISEILKDFR